MKKLILSRKGSDSKYGGFPSLITKEFNLISFPIPSNEHYDKVRYSNLIYQNENYEAIIKKLNYKSKKAQNLNYCHHDPDLNPKTRDRSKSKFLPLFGQSESASGHLIKQNVGINSIFLFFGWFSDYKKRNKSPTVNALNSIHAIFGYLEVKEVINLSNYMQYHSLNSDHPHLKYFSEFGKNNLIFLGNEKLSLDPQYPGYGYLKLNSEDIILTDTKQNEKKFKRTLWRNQILTNNSFTYHPSENFLKNGYFQSASIGQEFVTDMTLENEEYVKNLIKQNFDYTRI